MASKGKKASVPRKKANGYKMPAPIPLGEVIHDTVAKKKWRIGPSIGVGGFGEIYSACDHENSPKKGSNYPFVIKIEPMENGPLFVEKHFYIRNGKKEDIENFRKSKKLANFGMPLYFGHGSHAYKEEKYRYLVLERYGKDIWSLFKDSGRSFPPATVFQLGIQMLDVLEYIHSKGYVHADLKGANILMGLKKGTENQAYLVDFGLATRLNDKEFKPDPKCAHNGTIEYTSLDAHLGVPTMRGDLEILAYNMLQWLVGELPWENSLKQPKIVQQMKETFMKNVRNTITKQYGDVPDALVKFFEYIKSLGPKNVPNYAKCRQLFESYLKTVNKTSSSTLEFSQSKKEKISETGKRLIANGGQDNIENESKKLTKTTGAAQKTKKLGKTETTAKSEDPLDTAEKNDSDNNSGENEAITKKKKVTKTNLKRKSAEPALLLKVKKAKMAPKATPPASAQQGTRAIVRIRDPNCPSVSGVEGYIFFEQSAGKVRVFGNVTGLPAGEYGYNVHEKGDLSGGCATTGDHYNPDMKSHGHPHSDERHVGDLGNLKFDSNKFAKVDFVDNLLTLTGEWSIIGRAVVVHSMPDDYGLTDHPDSKITGNSGKELACGVIGWA